jgi:LysM repeat protein
VYWSGVTRTENPQTIALLAAATNIDPNPGKGGGGIIIVGGALVPQEGPEGANSTMVLPQNGQISVYVVREGDMLSQIAKMFGVSESTILWANDIKKANLIKPGDSLIILPVSGVRHTVKKGDTLASIAKLYAGDASDIIAYNGLSSESDIAVGETVVVPGGRIAAPPAPKKSAHAALRSHAPGAPPAGGDGYYTHPVPGAIRTQGIHGYNGVDLAAPVGTPIYAAAGGDVIIAKVGGWNGGYGGYIVIKHANGTQTLYAHLSASYVSVGQSVAQGESIGEIGSTGQSTGPHLHFEVRGAVNPF